MVPSTLEGARTFDFRTLAIGLVLLAAGCDRVNEAGTLQSARQHLESGQASTATIELKNLLQQGDEGPEARYLLGRALLESGDAAGAEIELERALRLKHPAEEVVPQLARALLVQQKYRKLTDTYGETEFTEKLPTAELKTTIASAYQSQGSLREADLAVAAALERVPGHVPALLMATNLTAVRGNVTRAAEMVDRIIVKAPDNVQAWILKGQLAETAGERSQAIEAFRKALQLKPDSVSAHAALISAYLSPPDMVAAETQWKAMREVLPNNPQTRFYEAKLAYLRGEVKRTRELTGELIGRGTSNVSLLQLAGAAEIDLKSPAQAEALLLRASALAPQAAAPRVLLGRAYVVSGQYGKALEALRPLVEGGNAPVEALILMAQARLMTDDAKAADALYARAMKLLPKNEGVAMAKAVTQAYRDPSDAAIVELQSVARQANNPTAALALVSALLARGELDRAAAAVEVVARDQPDSALPHELRGRIELRRGKIDSARAHFERALQKDPQHYAAIAALAGIDLAQGRRDAAKGRFQALLAKDPNQLQALLALAEIHAREGGAAEAAKLLNQAITAHPSNRGPRLILIDHYVSRREFKAAVTVAQAAVAVWPEDVEFLDRLGQSQAASGETQQALITYGRLAAMLPKSAAPHLKMVDIHVRAKDLTGARAAVRRASIIAPESVQVLRVAVSLAALDKDLVQAQALVRDHQKRHPNEAAGFLMEGELEVLRGDLPAAERMLRTAVTKEKPDEAARRLHQVLLAQKKNAEADRLASTWLGQHPTDVSFPQYLGDRAVAAKDWPLAERYYRMVVERDAEDAQGLNNVAWVLVQQGRPGASAFALRALKVSPQNPALMDTLALAYASENQLDKAIELQQQVVAAAPEAGPFRLNLAKLYLSAGHTAKAREQLNWLVSNSPAFADKAELQQLLARIDRKS